MGEHHAGAVGYPRGGKCPLGHLARRRSRLPEQQRLPRQFVGTDLAAPGPRVRWADDQHQIILRSRRHRRLGWAPPAVADHAEIEIARSHQCLDLLGVAEPQAHLDGGVALREDAEGPGEDVDPRGGARPDGQRAPLEPLKIGDGVPGRP